MENKSGIGKWSLVALVISSSLGSGVFGITSDLARSSAVGPVMLSWIIVGIGILSLILSLNNLGEKRADINGGIFGYGTELFGPIGGFISGWGYWLSGWLGQVAFATMLMSAIGEFFPIFKGGQNVPSIIFASIVIWALTYLVNKGVESASFINTIVTLAKLVPLFVFIIIMIVSFEVDVFKADFLTNIVGNMKQSQGNTGIWLQMKSCLMVMMWVFVGIEGATVLSRRAKKRSDAQIASIIGLLSLLVIYIFASVLPYGVLSQAELATMEQPAMANILKSVVGEWGAILINLGLITSILGCWLSWTMLPAETTMLMAKEKLLPKKWGRVNKKNAPTYSLICAGALTNLFLLTFLFTDYAYEFAYSMCTASILVCYLLVSMYQVKYSYQHKDNKQLLIGLVAFIFEACGIILAGYQYLLICSIAYVPGFLFYYIAKKEKNSRINRKEKGVILIITLIAVYSLIMIFTGNIKV